MATVIPGFTNFYTLFALLLLVFDCTLRRVDARQRFRVKPRNQRVREGHTLTLPCAIDNLGGTVMWAHNGDILGNDKDLPGYPRYHMIVNEAGGVYDLVIEQVKLEDDGEFQCQVSPQPGVPGSELLASAVLTVLIPPDRPFIEGYVNASVIEVSNQLDSLTIWCVTQNGRPNSSIYWVKSRGDSRAVNVTSVGPIIVNRMTTGKLVETKRSITIRPQFYSSLNNAKYTCVTMNEAQDSPRNISFKLSVTYPPPDDPIISGYRSGQVLTPKTKVRLKCISKGGNPLAEVIWLRNGLAVDYKYTQAGKETENIIDITVKRNDVNATYTCSSKNTAMKEPKLKSTKLTVHFEPDMVTITGKKLVKVGEQVMLTCKCGASNPAANIVWFYNGKATKEFGRSKISKASIGGYITSSRVKVTLKEDQTEATYKCSATNPSLGYTKGGTFTVTAQLPPGKPMIKDYLEGDILKPDQLQTFTCVSIGGNPAPVMTLKKGNEVLTPEPRDKKMIGNYAITAVKVRMKASDNGKHVVCTANNGIYDEIETRVKVIVYFPPNMVNMTMSTNLISAGDVVTLTCLSASSYPNATIKWKRGGKIVEGTTATFIPGEFFGHQSRGTFRFTARPEDNGITVGCLAENTYLREAAHDGVTLNVLYPPVFTADSSTTLVVKEHKSASLSFTVHANPKINRFKLYKVKRDLTSNSRFKVSAGYLNITNARKLDAGLYTVQAKNKKGMTTHNITINVLYQAQINRVTSPVSGDIDGKAVLKCTAHANPYVDGMVSWSRDDFDMTKTKQDYYNGTSTLTVYYLKVEDFGEFVCTAFNGIGSKVTRRAQLVVNFAPVIDKSPERAKAASERGRTGRIVCAATGAPAIVFKWFKDGKEIDTHKTKYSTQLSKYQYVKYTSTLHVPNVKKDDYGNYSCMASNINGYDTFSIILDGTSAPDPPYNLRFINATHNSITITWSPGFDGGLPTRFNVKYREAGDDLYVNVDLPHGQTVFTASGLKIDQEYELKVGAINAKGRSGFQTIPVMAKTDSVVSHEGAAGLKDEDDVPLIIILVVCIVGIFLLALNVALILFFIRRRKKRLENGSDSTSQTNTIELYGPSKETALYPFAETDAHSYTSYGKNLDDYHDDLNRSYDPEEDAKRVFLPPHDYGGRPYPMDEKDSPRPTRVAVYREDPDRHSPWIYDGQYPTGKNTFKTYSDVYLDKQRMYEQDTRPKELEGDEEREYDEGGFVPAPPQRSVSHEAYPPLPSRNYSPQGMSPSPRYVPPPGAVTTIVSTPSQRSQTRTLSPTSENPELMGRLV